MKAVMILMGKPHHCNLRRWRERIFLSCRGVQKRRMEQIIKTSSSKKDHYKIRIEYILTKHILKMSTFNESYYIGFKESSTYTSGAELLPKDGFCEGLLM